jgi:hypothetical protein
MKLKSIVVCLLSWKGIWSIAGTAKLFPVEQDLSQRPSDLDTKTFPAEFVLPLTEEESFLSLSEIKSTGENVECKLDCITFATERSIVSLPAVADSATAFDPLTSHLYVWGPEFKIFRLNKTAMAFDEANYSNLPPISSNNGEQTQSTVQFIHVHSAIFNDNKLTDERVVTVIIRGQMILLLDHSVKSKLFAFNLGYEVDEKTMVKFSNPINQSTIIMVIHRQGVNHLSVYHIDLNAGEDKVLSTTIDIKFLTEAVAARGETIDRPFDVAIYHKSEVQSPIILLLSKNFGLFKFIDVRNDGNFQLQVEETQFIFGNIIAVANKTVAVVKVNQQTNVSELQLYRMFEESTGLIQ